LSGEAGLRRQQAVRVVAEVYNVRGQRIRRLLSADLAPGKHTLAWDGRNDRGEFVGAGVYVLRLRAGSFAATRKLIVPGQ
jgi:flagellar hook assembly protein FlgD